MVSVEEYTVVRKETNMVFKSDKMKTWLEDENGKQIAVLDHPEVRPGVVNLAHTEVDPSLGGQGIAGKLMNELVKDLAETDRKAVLTCSYAVDWFERHEEYRDLLAKPDEKPPLACKIGGKH